jgi:hypothetical protein
MLFILIGCSSNKIVYDYDNQTDFEKFKTFDFYEDVGAGMNEIDAKRAKGIIEEELKAKGFKKSGNPDFLINFTSQKTALEDNNAVGVGIGGGRNVGIGISGGITIGAKKVNEEFIVEFVNTQDNQLFWQGISNKKIKEKITPEERVLYLQAILKKTFEQYPPKKK